MQNKIYRRIFTSFSSLKLSTQGQFLYSRQLFYFRSTRSLWKEKQDFYGILGVSRKATKAEIKKAYYDLAQKYHPDKNDTEEAKEKFADISVAYETLIDENKRQIYNSTGLDSDEQAENPFAGGFWTQSESSSNSRFEEDLFDEFEQFMHREGGAGSKKHIYKGEDIMLNMEISFLDSVLGNKKELKVKRDATCPTCKGTRCKEGTTPSKCYRCGGKGQINYSKGALNMDASCYACKGTGETIKFACPDCKGNGIKKLEQIEEVNIPKGINKGQNLKLIGRGDRGKFNGPGGDLIVRLKIKPDDYFKRDEFDIKTNYYINVSEAALGHSGKVKTLYGDLDLEISPGTQDGNETVLRGYGITNLPPNENKIGDHHITFRLVIPKPLSSEQEVLFEALENVKTVEQKIERNDDESQVQREEMNQKGDSPGFDESVIKKAKKYSEKRK